MSTSQDTSDLHSRGPAGSFRSSSPAVSEEKQPHLDELDPLDKISPEMRRFVEDKDYLSSFLRRENRFMVATEEEEKRPRRTGSFKQPVNTVPYIVKQGETLPGIALCNNITVSRLKTLNRLGSSMLFSGQVLYVPASVNKTDTWEYVTHADAGESAVASSSSGVNQASAGSKLVDSNVNAMRATSAEIAGEFTVLSKVETNNQESAGGRPGGFRENSVSQEEEVDDRHVKLKAKYITDGKGTVSGMLLVTSQCLMFNPSVFDPLVVDQGIDSYSLILPMEAVSSCAVYDDFIKMQQKDKPAGVNAPDGQQTSDQFLLCSRSIQLPIVGSASSSVEHKVHGTAACSLGTTKLSGDTNTNPEAHELYSIAEPAENNDVTGVLIDNDKHGGLSNADEPIQTETKEHARHVEVFGLNLDESCEDLKKPEGSASTPSDVGGGEEEGEKESIEDKDMEDPFNKASLGFHRVSDAFEVPVVAMSASKQETKSKPITIPQSSRHLSKVNRFFCVQLSAPLDDPSITKSAISVPTSATCQENIGRELRKVDGVKPEYWFAIALERVDQLYAFLIQWCPCLQEMSYEQMKEIEKDFVLISMTDLPEKQRLSFFDGHFGSGPRRLSRQDSSLGVEINPVPILSGETKLLKFPRLKKLTESLPRRLIGYDWTLIYSTFCHGISLKTLYRNMLDVTGPVVLIVQDDYDQVFGALLSDPLRLGEHSYGTGECFLFTFYPEFKRFGWTGNDPYFIKGNLDSFVVGGGDGHYGLWIDDNLYRGTTQPCTTFNNEILAMHKDFTCQSLEAWRLY